MSPIALVPKSSRDQWSVNDGIDSSVASVVYASPDEAVLHILRLGKGT